MPSCSDTCDLCLRVIKQVGFSHRLVAIFLGACANSNSGYQAWLKGLLELDWCCVHRCVR